MLAIGIRRYGGSAALESVALPAPHTDRGEVRIRVQAAAINPVDLMLCDGSLARRNEGHPFPHVPGMDVAGVVDEVGPQSDTDLAVGDLVTGIVDNRGSHGGMSRLVVLPSRSVTRAPSGLDAPRAAAFLMNALTARRAIDLLALPPGATLLVTGAAGAVGGFALRLASDDGLRVIGAASTDDVDFVQAQGAGFVARDDDMPRRVRLLAPDGVDAVLDAAGVHEAVLPAIRDEGMLVDLRGWEAPVDRGIRILHADVREVSTDREAIARLRDAVQAGRLPVRVAAVVPAERARHAFDLAQAPRQRGRVVLDLRDPWTTPTLQPAREATSPRRSTAAAEASA